MHRNCKWLLLFRKSEIYSQVFRWTYILIKQQLIDKKIFSNRDLAARNCLIHIDYNSKTESDRSLNVKIGDFGLARELYSSNMTDYYKPAIDANKLLPIRWMSPESILEGIYTTKSDVWSYGIVAWEIITLGFQPYSDLKSAQCIGFIRNGGKLTIPSNCPVEM